MDVRIPGRASLVVDIANASSSVGISTNSQNMTTYAARLTTAFGQVIQENESGSVGSYTGNFKAVTLPTTDGGASTIKTFHAGLTNLNQGVADVCSDGQNIYFATPFDNRIMSLDATSATGATATSYASGNFGPSASPTQAYVVAWQKQQLVAAGPISVGPTSGTWRLFAVGAGAGGTSVELLPLPSGWIVFRNCITSIAGFILFGASHLGNSQSVVYAWDGTTNAPYVCAELPDGDIITSMGSYLGVEVTIGARRTRSTGLNTASGAFYIAQATAAGQLILQEVVEIGDNGIPYPIGTTTGLNDYAVTGITSRGRYSYFTWQPFGLGVYDHANQAYSRWVGDLGTPAGSSMLAGNSPSGFGKPAVGDLVLVNRRLCFAVANSPGTGSGGGPLWAENINTLVTSGQILGSVFDWNIDKPKSINQAEIGTLPLPAGTSATLAYSTDGGLTSSAIGTLSGTGATVLTSSATSSPPLNFFATANTINYLATLTSDVSTHTLSPVLKKAGFGAWYGSKPSFEWQIYLRCDDRLTGKNGAPYVFTGTGGGVAGPAPTLSDQIVAKFRALRNSQAIVDWQPPGWGDTRSDSYKVQVRGYQFFRWFEPGAGPAGGAIRIDLKQAP